MFKALAKIAFSNRSKLHPKPTNSPTHILRIVLMTFSLKVQDELHQDLSFYHILYLSD
ncbi:hypothetical protein E2320_021006, partial [Naja naja]